MDDSTGSKPASPEGGPHSDPEIAALLDFEPVERKCKRHDGWTPDVQRLFVAALAETGNPDRAAHPLGRTGSGAWKVRTSAGAEGFAAAWDKAVALYRRRNPGARSGRPPGGSAWGGAEPAAPAPEADPAADEKDRAELFQGLIRMYWAKVKGERRCRLAGRIVEADFYVRQLTCIEIACDLAGNAQALLAGLKRGGVRLDDAAATPLSLYFDYLRRSLWAEAGEPDRPELPRFGELRDGVAAYPPTDYNSAREGIPYGEWCRRQDIEAADAAEAQRLWEEKARADAAAWRERLERDDPAALAAALAGPEFAVDWDAEAAEWRERVDGADDADGTEARP